MHYLHLILVSALNAEDATAAAVSVISDYGDGKVWDWHEEDAGRWKDTYPGPVAAASAEFQPLIEGARVGQQSEVRRLAEHVLQGPRPFNPTAPRVEWGNPQFKAQFMAGIQAYGEWLYQMTERLPSERDYNWGMVGYAVQGISNTVEGEYQSGSCFYDGLGGGAAIPSDAELAQYLEQAKADGEDLWLVPIDLHN